MVCLSKQHDFSYEERVQEKAPYSPKFRYQRDPIGNRITSTTTESGSPVIRNYTSNALNQYTAIDSPAQSPTYNDDGCMLNDGTWSFTWDGENRMASATNGSQTLEFKYDYQGRRVEKRVLDGGSETSKKRFVYDGYLQIEELDALNSNAILKKRVWSGRQLISETQGSTTYYALSDANKNVTEYIDASGVIQGHFEYSPFGKITVANGVNPDAFDFRFSSEYLDSETGLVYYNFRYYSPELGRWMSRDPIEEEGGMNLYGMVDNDAINLWDWLGLEDMPDTKPSMWDHLPSGYGGISTNEVNNNKWFETNYKGWVAHAKQDLNEQLNRKVLQKCPEMSTNVTVDGLYHVVNPKYQGGGFSCAGSSEGSSSGRSSSTDKLHGSRDSVSASVDDRQNETLYGDKPQTAWSSDKVLGRFVFQVRDVKVAYEKTNIACSDGKCKITYSYTASVVIEDGLGVQPMDPAHDKTFGIGKRIAPYRPVVRARWPISGEGECCEK